MFVAQHGAYARGGAERGTGSAPRAVSTGPEWKGCAMGKLLKGLVIAVVGLAMLGATTVLAGGGVNAVFNLGVTNTVNALTPLTGVAAGPQELLVVNSSTAASSTAIRGNGAANSPAIW